ncbi:hypothetical protein EV646_101238 [Kribbella antiqua]|uniref:GcrA cell cycle regulator n=1 Tax=Kribbella antiqua TaxID=2512217 RepID=A0A4R2J860_9ACTN|nr:hypothetical protein [Kribbella antiqua]TCO51255.1 hypothetical protein EV646_101238 [Kribbella antiqua]
MTSQSNGRDWTEDDVRELRELAAGHTPTGVIIVKLGRSEAAIRAKAESEGIPLAPANRAQS